MKKLILGLAAASLCALAPLPAFAGTLEDGLSAHETGNSARAAKLFRRAADEGDTRAYLNLGIFYEQGIGVKQSDIQAFYWYNKAANIGDVNGQYNVANMYMDGRGTLRSEPMAIKWYRKAAAQGHIAAQYNMGVNYYMGAGVTQSVSSAKTWFKKAAAQGNEQAADALKRIRRQQAKEFNKQLKNGQ